MSTTTWHTIREASMISGLPESTLRYYEQIGIIAPIARDPSSGHRAYTDEDIQSLVTISCLSATGMPLDAMREYLKTVRRNRRCAQAMALLDCAGVAFGRKSRKHPGNAGKPMFPLKHLYWRGRGGRP